MGFQLRDARGIRAGRWVAQLERAEGRQGHSFYFHLTRRMLPWFTLVMFQLGGRCSFLSSWGVCQTCRPLRGPCGLQRSVVLLSLDCVCFSAGPVLFCWLSFPSFKSPSVAPGLPLRVSSLSNACFFCINSGKRQINFSCLTKTAEQGSC